MHRSHLGSGALCSTSLRIKYLSKFFKILLHGKIILPLHLFANSIPCLYQYGFRDIYHILQTFNSIPLFFFFPQIVLPLAIGSNFSWLWCPFDLPLPMQCCFLVFVLFNVFTFWHYKILRAYLAYSLPQSQNQPFLQEALVLETNIWVLSVLLAIFLFIQLNFHQAAFCIPRTQHMKSKKYYIVMEFALKDVSPFWRLKLTTAQTRFLSLHTITDMIVTLLLFL